MTIGENQIDSADNTAPEQDLSGSPESVETTPPETTEPEEKPKTFTQEDLDRIVAKEKAKLERRLKREFTPPPQQPTVPSEPLSADQFESPEAYAEARALQIAQELTQRQELQKQQSQIEQAFHERVEAAMDKYDDFEEIAFGQGRHNVTPFMAETIKASEMGPDVAYYLGLNPEESNRIAELPPLLQAREIGKIEAKLAAEPPVKKASSAPAPIAPVTARNATAPAYDTTDPRSTKAMSDAEWIEAENARIRRKLEAERNR